MKKKRTPAPPRPPTRAGGPGSDVSIRAFQRRIEAIYGERDRARGLATTFMWFAEEVGELSRALRRTDAANLREEFADVLAWLATLASIAGVDLADATNKYLSGCPRCRATPCGCPTARPAAAPPQLRAQPRRRSIS